mmetsp:Transcript_1098/g.2672  ORF Transcript_1098/g.2672 Transcript_1098/m.2672 type:complete len:216 (+) Transcript_1098:88-735(+)
MVTPTFFTTQARWPTFSFALLWPAWFTLLSRCPYGKTAVDVGCPPVDGQPAAPRGHMLKEATCSSRSMVNSTQSPNSRGLTHAEALTMSAKMRMHIRPRWLTKMETILWMFFEHGSRLEKTKPTPSATLSSPEENWTRYRCTPPWWTSLSDTTESLPSKPTLVNDRKSGVTVPMSRVSGWKACSVPSGGPSEPRAGAARASAWPTCTCPCPWNLT